MDYQDRAEAAHQAAMERFYVPDARLFRETVPLRPGANDFSFLWPCIGMLSATTAMLGLAAPRRDYLALLRDLLAGVEAYWQAPGYMSYVAAAGGSQRYYDDNAWLGIEFLQAYDTLREQALLDRAQRTFDFVMRGWSDDVLAGGLYWREGDRATKNTCSNGPAAVLAASLYRLTGDGRYLDEARRLYDWTVGHLRTPDGLYWDNIDNRGSIDRRVYTYNAGIMIQAGLLLHAVTGDAQYRQDAADTAAASLAYFAARTAGSPACVLPPTPWFNAVLFRGFLALQAATGDSTYAKAVVAGLDAGWERARDERGMLHPDWSGRSGASQAYAELLDQAPVAEIYALAAQAAGSRRLSRVNGSADSDRTMPISWQPQTGHPVLSPLGTAGTASRFAGRGIYDSEQYGSQTLTGDGYAFYEDLGGPDGPLGFPLAAAEAAAPSPAGTLGRRQLFEGSQDYPPAVTAHLGAACGAVVYWTRAYGAHVTWFEIGRCYENTGGPAGPLGYPVSKRVPAAPSPQGTAGYLQRFEAGAIYWSPDHGTHPVYGAIAACYDGLGGSGGRLGYPLGDVSGDNRAGAAAGGSRQRFEGGWIYWQPGQGTQASFAG